MSSTVCEECGGYGIHHPSCSTQEPCRTCGENPCICSEEFDAMRDRKAERALRERERP